MSAEIWWMNATELAELVASRELSAREVADAMIQRVEAVNPKINALVNFDPENIMCEADRLDQLQIDGSRLGPLHGVPFTIKDLTAVRGVPLTLGIPAMRNHIPDQDAPVVKRLTGAGGLFLGKTNTGEAGYCGRTTNHLFGPTGNPWDTSLTPGGSSGGAGAAVAAGLGPIAEGSDGGGSIRVPASLNGVVGFKPSLGRVPQTLVSQRFLTNMAHGPLTRTVADAALTLDTMVGEDSRDPLSLPHPGFSFRDRLEGDLKGWRIAYSEDLGYADVDPEVADIVSTAVRRFEEAGADVVDATPSWQDINEALWKAVWVPGLSALGAMFDIDSMHGQLDEELIELVNEGRSINLLDYATADLARGAIYDNFDCFMHHHRLLVSPTTTDAAFPVHQLTPARLDGTSLQSRLVGWSLTQPFNLTGTPAISIPCGFTSDGRPVGMQLAGGFRRDEDVLRAARVFEQLQPWAHRRPPMEES